MLLHKVVCCRSGAAQPRRSCKGRSAFPIQPHSLRGLTSAVLPVSITGMLIDGVGKPAHADVCSRALTKTDLIEEVTRVTELLQKEAAVIVECILDSMVKAIERGDKIEIRGFGTFRTR